MNWYLKVVKDNYVNFSGRARRTEYWMFTLFNVVFGIGLGFLDVASGTYYVNPATGQGAGLIGTIYSFAVLLPSLAVAVRRLHDVGKSGWYLLLVLTIIGAIPVLIWQVSDSASGENDYGPNPKEID